MASAASQFGVDTGKDRFNTEAANWYSNLFVRAMSARALEIIREWADANIKERTENLDVLELGCGTGLLSLEMARYVRRIVAVDAASGMIGILREKLARPGAPENIVPLALLLENPEDMLLPPGSAEDASGSRLKYDLITSHLVLHHIPDVAEVLKTMFGCLKKGGSVALTDFEDFGPEARRFHSRAKERGVQRHGIRREWMAQLLDDAGFEGVQVRVGWTSSKLVEKFPGEFKTNPPLEGQGEWADFPFLLCTGRRG